MANKFNYKGFVKQTNTLHANLTDSQEKKRKENGGDDSPASGGSSPASHSPSTSSSTVDTRHTPAPSQIKAAAPHTSRPAVKKPPPLGNAAAKDMSKRLVGTVKAGGRVGKMLEMLENGGWDEVEREIKEREEREEKRREDLGIVASPRANGGASSTAVPAKQTSPSPSPSPRGPAATGAKKNEAKANGGAQAPKSHGLKPERRILAYGLGAVQGKRPTMEDAHAAYLELPQNPHVAFFGVYDGHAGDESSTYVAECLHDEIDRALARAQSTADWAAAVTSAFSTVDENLMDESESMMWTSGTTVVCAAFHKEERELWVANLGDSRCVLARHDQGGPKVVAEPLSSDHKPWVEGEIQRIERAGCRVTEGRINGTHAMSRAMGDFELKNNINLDMRDQAISNEPEIRKVGVATDELFVVLACDGLFDVMTDQEVVEWVYDRLASTNDDLDTIAERLAHHAVDIGSTDNVSVLIVTLPHHN